ncbi:hypothetical protein [Megalodesulfovibrio paquesii]
MAAPRTPDRDAALEQELAQLRSGFERLKEEKVRAEEQLASLEAQLTQLEEEALREYGVSDPESLQKLLDERRAENERRVAAYREHISGVQARLREVEQAAGAGE